ncbi:MAG: hypothetical protein WAW36_18880 [Methylovulum miyakonense]|uniref:hypothetical protein n=1 Tax=Methylovulum miyakonense TaxID=645578 RepID=UPI003BB71058
MTISETDLKLLKSENVSDFNEGGGRMTINEVIDGELNNLFDDISGLDRAYGRVSLRKSFLSVQTNNTDRYLGAHIIVTDAPDDNDVSVTMFSTESPTDNRVAARNRVESYTTLGTELGWVLMGVHAQGQKMLQLFSLSNPASLTAVVSEEAPEIGDVIVLSIEGAGYEAYQQYVRVTSVKSRDVQNFYDTTGTAGGGEFFKAVLLLEISDPLNRDFPGISPTRLTRHGSPVLVRGTLVSDVAEYYGVKKITQALSPGDVVVNIGSPYERLVPSNTAESPLVDVPVNSARANYIQAGSANDLTATANMGSTTAPDYVDWLYLGRGILPGSLVLTVGGVGYKDDKAGALVLANGNLGAFTGTVDYAGGKIEIVGSQTWAEPVVATATQAVVTYDNAVTTAVNVSINNRAFNWVMTLRPIPTPGTLTVDYRALNKWYRLYDDGNGRLAGRGLNIGTATVNYATGSVLMTLAALPDADTLIIFSWAIPVDYTRQTYAGAAPVPQLQATLANTPVVPGTLAITWTYNGVGKSASAGVDGVVSGDASGKFVAATGELAIKPTVLPASGTVFTCVYDQSLAINDVFTLTGDGAGMVTMTLAQTPIKPGSVHIAYHVYKKTDETHFLNTFYEEKTSTEDFIPTNVSDDANGHILDAAGTQVGSINYATGVTVFTAVATYHHLSVQGTQQAPPDGAVWQDITVFSKTYLDDTSRLAAGTTFDCQYAVDSASPTTQTEQVPLTQIKIDLSPQTNEDLVAGSLRFTYAGGTFIDRNGTLYRNQNRLTDSAIAAGSINYQTGLATLTSWTGGSAALSIKGAVTVRGNSLATTMFGRTPGAPLSTGQFQLVATTFDGVEIIATADNNGDIDHEFVQGHVDWRTGVYYFSFGHLMLDSALGSVAKASSWYNPANIDANGFIWAPIPIKTETATFNAVLVSYLPLDADILGINTVRLPQDGRVPIFRVGNLAVVHNTQMFTLPNPAVASATYNLGRTRLAYARLYDKNGLALPAGQYTKDLDAGTITMAADPNWTGYAHPFKCEHRVEDMRLVTDVQISGQTTLQRTLSHDYPANTSFISSALLIGDMQARVPVAFEQTAWSAVWSDVRSGNAPLAQYNNLLFPIQVSNRGAILERWVIVFTSATTFNCYGESYGLIAVGSINSNFAPVNPLTLWPYFEISAAGWGLGWTPGYCYRFNTVAANYPLWIARTTQQSEPVEFTDNFKIQLRGDSN